MEERLGTRIGNAPHCRADSEAEGAGEAVSGGHKNRDPQLATSAPQRIGDAEDCIGLRREFVGLGHRDGLSREGQRKDQNEREYSTNVHS